MYRIKLINRSGLVEETFCVEGEQNAFNKVEEFKDLVKRGFFGMGINQILMRDTNNNVVYNNYHII